MISSSSQASACSVEELSTPLAFGMTESASTSLVVVLSFPACGMDGFLWFSGVTGRLTPTGSVRGMVGGSRSNGAQDGLSAAGPSPLRWRGHQGRRTAGLSGLVLQQASGSLAYYLMSLDLSL